jgi:hemerythrin-like domain-containing protein
MIVIGAAPSPGFDDPLGLMSDCHRRIKRFLRVLVTITRRTRGDRLDPDERDAFATALRYFREAAPLHTEDEEMSLFPRLRALNGGTGRPMRSRLDRLHEDHERAALHHAAVDSLGSAWLAADHLERTDGAVLRWAVDRLAAFYRRHIAHEDGELFPLARLVDPQRAPRVPTVPAVVPAAHASPGR